MHFRISIRPTLIALLTCATLIAATGCIRLTGQRVSVFHDEKADQVRLLVFYDGVHETKADPTKLAQGREAIEKFAKAGDVMFIDWYGHIDREAVAESAASDQTPPKARALAQFFINHISTRPIGHYTDERDQIGAAQHIIVDRADEFLKKANAAISEAVANNDAPLNENAPRTSRLLVDAAKRGHAWVSLDGHAMVLRFPVHPGEWRRVNAEGLLEMITESTENAPDRADLRRLVQALTATPLSYSEADGIVTFKVGQKGSPSTLRFSMQSPYKANVEAAVRRAVPDRLTAEVIHGIEAVESGKRPADPAIADLLTWGPPEAAVLIQARRAASDDAATAADARAWLNDFSKKWAQSTAVPETPEPAEGEAFSQKAWLDWVGAMRHYPLPEPIDTDAAENNAN